MHFGKRLTVNMFFPAVICSTLTLSVALPSQAETLRAKTVRENIQAEEQGKKYDGMFALYQANRVQGIGNFITSDFVLTTYNLAIRKTIADAEATVLLSQLKSLVNRLQSGVQKSAPDRKGRTLALGYLSVVKCLLEPKEIPPAEVADKVRAELELIGKHAATATSPLLGVREDYSQYLPRGRYTRSPLTENYFRAVTYAGRQGFMIRASKATGVTEELADAHMEAALLLAAILQEDQETSAAALGIDRILTALIGQSDDLAISDVNFITEGADKGLPAVASAKLRQKLLAWAKTNNKVPKIVGGIVDKENLEKGLSPQEALQSVKLVGQRYTPDSEVFQGLVYDSVSQYKGNKTPFTMSLAAGKPVRGVPTILDLMAALGSKQSSGMITARDDDNYEGYSQQLAKASELLRSEAYNPASAAAANLSLARRLVSSDSPVNLNAALGSWIQNRHAIMLYAKQSYTGVGKSLQPTPEYPLRKTAAVEDARELYGDIIEALLSLSTKLDNQQLRNDLTGLAAMIQNLRKVVYLQTDNRVSAIDIDFLNNFDLKAKFFTGETDGPVAVDIHTDANSSTVLQEAIGAPASVWKQNDSLRGARYRLYEFRQPQDKRLTDEVWGAKVKAGETGPSLTRQITGAE